MCEGAAGPGGDPGITPPQTLQPGGEDYFEVCCYVRWQSERWQALTAALEQVREEAAMGDGTKIGAPISVPALGAGGAWHVHASGYRMGGTNKGPMVRWKVEREGVRIGIMNRSEPHATIPNVHVIITGDVLLIGGGIDAMWPRIKAWLADLGAEMVEHKVSRADVCIDVFDVGVAEFYDAFRDGRVVTRAKKAAEFGEGGWKVWKRGRRITGFTIGAAPSLTVYDKLEECSDPSILALLIDRKWGGKCPETVTRTEFRLRSEFLREGRWLKHEHRRAKWRKAKVVQTVEDWIEHRVAIVDYLTAKWVRFVEEGFDRRHTERSENTPFWARVCQQIVKLWERLNASPAKYDFSKVTDEAMLKQARGCLERVAAMKRMTVENAEDFLGAVVDWMAHILAEDNNVVQRIHDKLGSLAPPRRDSIPI